jgi:RNA polymerase sigma-70 factor, ECF subfamily
MRKQPEPEIINNRIAGDTSAFRLLVEMHQAFTYSLAFRFLNNQTGAQDVTQEAFIRLWKHLPESPIEMK